MSNNNATLSFSGDVCEDGTLTVCIAIAIFSVLAIGRYSLYVSEARAGVYGKTQQGLSKGHLLEKTFIYPFVPRSLETFIAAICFAWFVMTIPMAITRFYENRWAHQLLAQQGTMNAITKLLFGCEGLDIEAIPYPLPGSPPDPEEDVNKKSIFRRLGRKNKAADVSDIDLKYDEHIDFYFGYHLACGILWLLFGSAQIFLARNGWSTNREVNKKYHKRFGVVALTAFFGHIYMAVRMSWYNPVHQVLMIKAQYWATIFESVLLVCLGLLYIRRGERAMHMVRMVFAFLQSVFGSGAVRLTAWILWVIGKFFPLHIQVLIDRGVCQTMAIDGYDNIPGMEGVPPGPMGSAEYCWKSVFLNLAVTDLLILWLEWIFLASNIEKFTEGDKKATVSKFKHLLILLISFILLVAFSVPDWIPKTLVLVYAGIIRINSLRMWIASFARDPILREPPQAVEEDTLITAQRLVIRGVLYVYCIEEEPQAHQD